MDIQKKRKNRNKQIKEKYKQIRWIVQASLCVPKFVQIL